MTQAQALTLKLNLAQERECQGGSSSQRSLRALSGSGESQSPGSTPPLVLQSGSQTVICTWITWGSAKLKILTPRDPRGAKFLISNRLPGDVDAAGPSAALYREWWRREWCGVGREERNGGAEVWGAVGWRLCRESGSTSLLSFSSTLVNCC